MPVRRRFYDLAFTPAVQAEQACRGSRAAYAAAAADGRQPAADPATPVQPDLLDEQEFAYLAARDSFYLASVSQSGWPYVQHRGGPAGFVRRIDARTIGWAEYTGNRQYVSAGNTAADDRVAMIFVDYPNRDRLKILGHLHAHDAATRPDLVALLGIGPYRAHIERYMLVTVEAFDWNCPQHITPRFTLEQVNQLAAPLHARIAELEARLREASAS